MFFRIELLCSVLSVKVSWLPVEELSYKLEVQIFLSTLFLTAHAFSILQCAFDWIWSPAAQAGLHVYAEHSFFPGADWLSFQMMLNLKRI